MLAQSTHQQTENYDVIVVGAGPAGLTTATALARHGIRVLVIEKHPGLSIFPKAIGVRPRSMEIFRGWGLETEIGRRSQPGRTTMRVGPSLSSPGQEVSLGLPDAAALRPLTPVDVALCGQDQVEAVLYEQVVAHGGVVRFRTELTAVTQTGDGVRATVRSRDDSHQSVITSRFLVGADGGRSLVRSLTNIGFETLGSEGDHLSFLFRADLSSVMPDPPHVLNVVVGPEVNGLFASTAMSNRWIWDMEWHPEAGERVTDWTPARVTTLLRRATGLPDLEPEILGAFPWDFGAGVAAAYRSGRIFLVGDAAHRTTPRGATGMNTGIADAHNLGWKLVWVIKGWAGESLLDSYEAEREPVGRGNATASMQSMIGRPASDGLAHDFGVCYASGGIVGGTPLAGRRAPHAWVELGGRRVSTLDLFDGRFTVITGRDGHDWRAAVTDVAAGGGPVVALSVGTELADPDGELAERYGLTDQGVVLIRPDGHVVWGCSAMPAGAGDRLADVLGLATGHRVADLVG